MLGSFSDQLQKELNEITRDISDVLLRGPSHVCISEIHVEQERDECHGRQDDDERVREQTEQTSKAL